MDIFKPANMIVVFANIIFFMVVQTLFFKYVASKQFNIVLTDKAKIVQDYLGFDETSADKFKSFKASPTVQAIKEKAKNEEDMRTTENNKTMLKWIGIPVFISIFIMMAFIVMIFIKKDEDWDRVDTVLLSFVFCAYIAEILFYLGIVNKYEFYGDQLLYSNLYEGISANVNKDPITAEGKKYKAIMNSIIKADQSYNIDTIKKGYREKQKELPGISEDYFITYANTRTQNISNYVNADTFNIDTIGTENMPTDESLNINNNLIH